MPRTGVFISHAHDDREIAEGVRRLLEVALAVSPEEITCTSDPEYGFQAGAELTDQIRQRLQSARALLLLVTRSVKGKDWVNFEAAYADSAQAEMRFFILTPTPADIEFVPAPYKGRLAVTLNHGADVHTFIKRLQQEFKATSAVGSGDAYVSALLELERRCTDLQQDRAQSEAAEQVRQAKAEYGKVVSLNRWALPVVFGCGLAVAAVAGWWKVDRDAERCTSRLSEAALEADAQRIAELKSLPFSGLLLDGRFNRVPCTEIDALVPEGQGQADRRVHLKCDGGEGGTFTFTGGELQADPLQTITLLVHVGDRERRVAVTRALGQLAIPVAGVAP